MQKVKDHNGEEMLYILNFYLPRFLNLPLKEKLDTVLHELWHIGPKFDGDLRRFGNRCFAHGPSKKQYDRQVAILVVEWLELSPPKSVYDFLQYNFHELDARHGRIIGSKIPAPKMYCVD